jgi:hypothetical protein
MEGAVQSAPSSDIRLPIDLVQHGRRLIERLQVELATGEAQLFGFKKFPYCIDLADLLPVHPSDERPTRWMNRHETFGLELPQGIADRHATESEASGELILPQGRFGLQRASGNSFPQRVGDLVSDGLRALDRSSRHPRELVHSILPALEARLYQKKPLVGFSYSRIRVYDHGGDPWVSLRPRQTGKAFDTGTLLTGPQRQVVELLDASIVFGDQQVPDPSEFKRHGTRGELGINRKLRPEDSAASAVCSRTAAFTPLRAIS